MCSKKSKDSKVRNWNIYRLNGVLATLSNINDLTTTAEAQDHLHRAIFYAAKALKHIKETKKL